MTVFKPANILLPKLTDFTPWSVIACDQYTSDREYWANVRRICEDKPSTLNLIFPEVYLKDTDAPQRIRDINAQMTRYLSDGLFEEYKDAYIYVERTLSDGSVRHGIVGMLDLEEYSYEKGAQTLVRATEGTVIDRLPPRVKIRRDAPLELPHIMMLIDDRSHSVIEPLDEHRQDMATLYDFDLMLGGGHITGRLISDSLKDNVNAALDKLLQNFDKTYGLADTRPLLFAAGDGNHSLATAKKCYEDLKASGNAAAAAKARYALVEVVNLHDDSLKFEPIHRAVFNVDIKELISKFNEYFPGSEVIDNAEQANDDCLTLVTARSQTIMRVPHQGHNLLVGALQQFLDELIKSNPDIEIDYIHGDDDLRRLAENSPRTAGFLLPAMAKNELFRTVILDGALPRKTFSMGMAQDKRYYLECRKIK